ncbi:MAG: hypothetical protein IKU52_01505, partial [Clostridia bacterium]|nr:hypothetical protein [Clostridia bacterium]
MTYLVMETHLSHAVVLDENGAFIKVANMGYCVGQKVDNVIALTQDKPEKKLNFKKLTAIFVAAALCFALIAFSAFQVLAVGTVRIQINPDVLIKVNRFDTVVSVTGLNEDGELLIKGEKLKGKKISEVSDFLADKAMEMGYLKEGGNIKITVDSKNKKWKKHAEDMIVIELDAHFNSKVKIDSCREEVVDEIITEEQTKETDFEESAAPVINETQIVTPEPPSSEVIIQTPGETVADDDNDDDDNDYDYDDDNDEDDDDD